jgi:para-aminobenzoate synthetase component 1
MQLPYCADPLPLLAALRPLGRPVLLQSTDPGHPGSRYDILSAAPLCALETRGSVSLLYRDGGVTESTLDPFLLLDDLLAELPATTRNPAAPFRGGILGIAGYDLARRLETLPRRLEDDTGFPDLAAGLYSWALVTDHRRRLTRIRVLPGHQLPPGVGDALQHPLPVAPARLPTLQPEVDRAAYGEAFDRVQEYIRAGDCYQVNLAVRFHGRSRASGPELYRALAARHPAPFSGYLETPSGSVLSLSPERLLRFEKGRVVTSPIKGTRPRDADPVADAAQSEALLASTKVRAENLMIVDLLRNDLGRSCIPGSIRVPELFRLQSFGSVHHLVSTIEGQLRDGVTPLTALSRAFPGCSITGAPKVRAMEIIEELESARRGPYCGSLFRADAGGRLDSSICIRSLLQVGEDLWCWGGGGVVADSQADEEWAEIHHKVRALVEGEPD